MKLLQTLRTKYNHVLESTIRVCVLTAVTFTVTACYGTPPDDFYMNNPKWKQDQDTLEHRIEKMGKEVVEQENEGDEGVEKS